MAKIQGHRNPFHPDVMALNIAQIDFVLEMAAIDEPQRWHFQRGTQKNPAESLASWHNIFEGGALQRFLGPMLNLSVLKRYREQRPKMGLRGKGVADAK